MYLHAGGEQQELQADGRGEEDGAPCGSHAGGCAAAERLSGLRGSRCDPPLRVHMHGFPSRTDLLKSPVRKRKQADSVPLPSCTGSFCPLLSRFSPPRFYRGSKADVD